MKKYSIFSNCHFCFKDMMSYSKVSLVYFILYIFSSLAAPIMSVLVTTIVIYCLTNNYPVNEYIYIVLGLCFGVFFFNFLKYFSVNKYNWNGTFTRCVTSWNRLSIREITTDYSNIETREKKKIFSKGMGALDSNWIGIERTMKEYPIFIFSTIGMVVYGTLVAIYTPYILIVLVLMVVSSYLLNFVAYNYLEKHRSEDEKIWTERDYIDKDVSNIDNAKDIRIYRLEKMLLNFYDQLTKKRINYERGFSVRVLFGDISNSVFGFIRDGVAYLTLILLVINKTIDVSTFTFLIGIVAGFSTWSNSFVSSLNELKKASILINDYRYALTVKNEFNHDKGIDTKSLKLPLEVEFKNVSFIYPGSKKATINNINLKIHSGEKLAIVGNNGAGKTTLIKLLCGLYKPTSGEILINGHSINEFNIDEYMDLISAVFQDSEPLALTVLNNVTCSIPKDADMDRFWKACDEAGIKDKVLSLKDKENTFVTQRFDESGVRFSGGETQKLMLARALYKDSPLLVLDEPTAALDPISEEKMYKIYLNFTKNSTSVFISHRLASTRFCDDIIFLNNGEIEEEGNHETLMKNNKLYKEMFDIQAKYYKEGENEDGKEEFNF